MIEKMCAWRRLLCSLLLPAIAVFMTGICDVSCLSAQNADRSGLESHARAVVQLGYTGTVFALALAPDGRTALTGGEDGSLRLWDVASGRQIRVLDHHSYQATSIVFSPDGQSALSASRHHGLFNLWDLASGRELQSFGPDLVREKIAGDAGGKVKRAAAELDLDRLCRASDGADAAHQTGAGHEAGGRRFP